MPDYVRLLNTAIKAAPYGAVARGLVYNRARNALVSELRVASCLPSEITRQRMLLEEAIRAVENAAVSEWLGAGRSGLKSADVRRAP